MQQLQATEHEEQSLLIQWFHHFSILYEYDENLLFAIPNGGQRNIITARKLKQEGVRAGIPDLFLAIPQKGYHGLFIEMKVKKGGKVSEFQKDAIEMLKKQGYSAVICHGFDEAVECIKSYLL